MAKKVIETEVATTPTEVVNADESTYTISEFTSQAHMFKTSPFVVKTALELSGKTEFTLDEAKKIINYFKNKEV